MRSVKDFMDLYQEELLPEEVDVLMHLDNRYLAVHHRLQEGMKNEPAN